MFLLFPVSITIDSSNFFAQNFMKLKNMKQNSQWLHFFRPMRIVNFKCQLNYLASQAE